jgi:DNA-binding MarR family transcriptional regulator
MITSTTSTDPLVDALTTRLRRVDLVAWQRIAAWAEESDLSLEDLRLLLALVVKAEEGPAPISELAEMAGFPLEVAYPVIHRLRGRGYLVEARRRYSLSPQGEQLVATLHAVHRQGIQTYVDGIDPEERKRLDAAFEIEE